MTQEHVDAFLAFLDARIRTIRKELAEVPAHGSFRKERELLLSDVEGIRLAFLKIMGQMLIQGSQKTANHSPTNRQLPRLEGAESVGVLPT